MLSVSIVILLAACGAACALGLLWWLSKRIGRARATGDDPDRIDTLAGWPPQATRVLSTVECQAYSTLVRALPDCMVLAQVPLSRFLRVPKRYSYADWLRRLGNQCADFVICDMHAQVLAVVELQPPAASAGDRAQRRMERMARSLKAAKVPLHVWTEGLLPSADAAREAITPRPVSSPSVAESAGSRSDPATPGAAAQAPIAHASAAAPAPNPAPATATNPFEDTGRDSMHDERIELLEPPPSTWFDELDSGPVPLRRPSAVKPARPERIRGR